MTEDTKIVIDAKSKKRKTTEPPLAKAAPPAKKAAVAPAAASAATPTAAPKAAAVKKEVKPVVAVKDAKSDSSFFSAPKPKAKLPSFKKSAAELKGRSEPSDTGVAQPSAVDPFQELLKGMGKRKESPGPAPSSSASVTPAPAEAGPSGLSGRPAKKRKSVTWAAGDQLEKIKWIEKAIYDDDPLNVCLVLLCINYRLLTLTRTLRALMLRTVYAIWTGARVQLCIKPSLKR
jgi:protein phosphatase 1 regulatory subunit 10